MKKSLWILSAVALAILGIFIVTRLPMPQPAPPPPVPGPNAFKAVDALLDGSQTIKGEIQRVHALRSYTHYSFPGGESGYEKALQAARAKRSGASSGSARAAGSAGPTASKPLLFPPGVPNLHDCPTAAKAFSVEATFLMLEGKRSEGLQLLADSEYLGQLLAQTNILIVRMVGVSWCMHATDGLETFVFNDCFSLEDFAEAEQVLTKLASTFHASTASEIGRLLHRRRMSLLTELLVIRKQEGPMLADAATVLNYSVARVRLLQMAAAARSHRAESGRFPTSAADFAPLLPNGLPMDPFAHPPAPLRFRLDSKSGDFVCYSVGPDGKDGQGRLAVGIYPGRKPSSGDIVLTIPAEARSFPRNGVRADTVDDLNACFPGGLPTDPFTRKPLRALGSNPVWLYSVGHWKHQPDLSRISPGEIPILRYDPTNGVASQGLLPLRIPGKI